MMCTEGTQRRAVLLSAALALAAAGPAAAATSVEHFVDAFTADGLGLDMRWRMEHVRQANFDHKALAMPLRVRLSFGSHSWRGWSMFAEYDQIVDFGLDTYDEGGGNTPGRGDYPVVADPAGGDVNQAWLQWQSETGDRLRGGRQRIIYDNARFIGNVGWRQNEQTYDGLSYAREKLGNWDLRAAWIGNTNRIFGDDVPAGDHEMDTWLANVSHTFKDVGKLTGYYYRIDNDDAPDLSNATLGVRFTGTPVGEEVQFGYGLEYAHQEDTGSNPVPYDADYWRLDLSVHWANPTLYAGYESLGGDDRQPGQAFRTPLATLHAFNGWADQFLATPPAGLDDLFVGVKGKLGAWSWNILYHDFSAQSGAGSYGHELDGSLGTKFGDKLGFLLKAAKFEADSAPFQDTTKLWVMVTLDI